MNDIYSSQFVNDNIPNRRAMTVEYSDADGELQNYFWINNDGKLAKDGPTPEQLQRMTERADAVFNILCATMQEAGHQIFAVDNRGDEFGAHRRNIFTAIMDVEIEGAESGVLARNHDLKQLFHIAGHEIAATDPRQLNNAMQRDAAECALRVWDEIIVPELIDSDHPDEAVAFDGRENLMNLIAIIQEQPRP